MCVRSTCTNQWCFDEHLSVFDMFCNKCVCFFCCLPLFLMTVASFPGHFIIKDLNLVRFTLLIIYSGEVGDTFHSLILKTLFKFVGLHLSN